MPECQLNPPMVDRLQAQTRPFVPANTENFLADVCRPELSLAELAERYRTTVDALSVWLSRPDVLQRLAEIRSVSAQRAGFIAGMHLPHYAHALSISLHQAVTESDFLGHLTLSLESNTLRVRYRENIRKTVALLTNIARLEHRRAPRPAAPNPGPKPAAPQPPRVKSRVSSAAQPPSAPNTRPANRTKASQSRRTRAIASTRSASAKPPHAARPGSESRPRHTRANSSPRRQSRSSPRPARAPKPQSKASPATSAQVTARQQSPRSHQTLPGPAP